MSLTKAIYNELIDAGIGEWIGEYNGAPALFTGDLPPEDVNREEFFVLVRPSPASSIQDTKARFGASITHDITCYVKDTGTVEEIDELAKFIRNVFHRNAFEYEGGFCKLALVTPPVSAPVETRMIGRLLSVQFNVTEV